MTKILMTLGIMMAGIISSYGVITNVPVQFNSPNQFGSSSNTSSYYPSTLNVTKGLVQYQTIIKYQTNVLVFTNLFTVTNIVYITNITQIINYVTVTNVINVTNTAASTSSYIVAASGSCVDVQNAIAAAQVQGITNVWVPPGSNIWSCSISDAGVNLLASNTFSVLMQSNSSTYGIFLNAGANVGSTITVVSNFLFDVDPATGPGAGQFLLQGSNVCFRITHCTFLNGGTGASGDKGSIFLVGGDNSINTDGPFGLVDHCNFYYPLSAQPLNIFNIKCNGSVTGYCWRQTNTWGQLQNVVIESNNISVGIGGFFAESNAARAALEAASGARFVFRYNYITNATLSAHGTQSDSPGVHQGTLEGEVYNNTFVYTNGDNQANYDYLMLFRGGSYYVYSNSFANEMAAGTFGINVGVKLTEECAGCGWASEFCPAQLTTNQYPALEQIGQGLVAVNGTGLVPTMLWSNAWPNTALGSVIMGSGGCNDVYFIIQGRDAFANSPPTNYIPLVFPHPNDK